MTVSCEFCQKTFRNPHGLKTHQASCRKLKEDQHAAADSAIAAKRKATSDLEVDTSGFKCPRQDSGEIVCLIVSYSIINARLDGY